MAINANELKSTRVRKKLDKTINKDKFWDSARKANEKIMAKDEAEYQMKNARVFNSGEARDDEHRKAWKAIDSAFRESRKSKR